MERFRNGKEMMEPWIETHSGRQFWFDGRKQEVNIHDIAWALSNVCRFNGHCEDFYSVAEHSVYVSYLVPEELKLAALLHDASEAFISDLPKPAKLLLPDYQKLEKLIMVTIADSFFLPNNFWEYKEIKEADWSQLKEEAKVLLLSKGKEWYFPDGLVGGFSPQCLSPESAYDFFITSYNSLTNEDT